MQIGCCGNTGNYPVIAGMGYDYAELSGRDLMRLDEAEFAAFQNTVERTGLPVLGINDFCGAEHPIVGPKADLQDGAAYMKAVCRRAQALGASRIGLGAPTARKLQAASAEEFRALYERADIQMADYLQQMAAIAEAHGITLLLEAVHDRMCDYLTHTEEAVQMVRDLGIPNLRLVFDAYHAEVMDEGAAEMQLALPLTAHLHYSTDLGANDRGYVTEESYSAFRGFLKAAAAGGYDQTVSVEANPAYLERDGRTCARLMRQAAEETAVAIRQAG